MQENTFLCSRNVWPFNLPADILSHFLKRNIYSQTWVCSASRLRPSHCVWGKPSLCFSLIFILQNTRFHPAPTHHPIAQLLNGGSKVKLKTNWAVQGFRQYTDVSVQQAECLKRAQRVGGTGKLIGGIQAILSNNELQIAAAAQSFKYNYSCVLIQPKVPYRINMTKLSLTKGKKGITKDSSKVESLPQMWTKFTVTTAYCGKEVHWLHFLTAAYNLKLKCNYIRSEVKSITPEEVQHLGFIPTEDSWKAKKQNMTKLCNKVQSTRG